MPNIVNAVYLSCVSLGANICSFPYDGQWHYMMARGLDDKPHTRLSGATGQQVVLWNEVSSIKKSEIVKAPFLLNANPSYKFIFVKVASGAL